MFAYDQFDGLSKDQTIYPKFTSQLAKDAREQTMRTIVEHLVTNKGDYRDLFTTKKTFMNRSLASLYKIPLPGAEGNSWLPYSFGRDDPRGGILTLAAFLMLDATHEGRSSPTTRGKSVRELLLCQPVPVPPPNVDFSAVQDINNQVHKTARQRLTVHQENPACAGCHAITDPLGLAMENYDAIGQFRTHENGALIDASGTLEGKEYRDAISLQKALRDNTATPTCVAQRAFEYGVGRPLTKDDEQWLESASRAFSEDKYQFPALMRRIATSMGFRSVQSVQIASAK